MQACVPEDFPSANGVAAAAFSRARDAIFRLSRSGERHRVLSDRKYPAMDGREARGRSRGPPMGATFPSARRRPVRPRRRSPSTNHLPASPPRIRRWRRALASSSRLGKKAAPRRRTSPFPFQATTMARRGPGPAATGEARHGGPAGQAAKQRACKLDRHHWGAAQGVVICSLPACC